MTNFIPPKPMVTSDQSARQIFENVMSNPARKRFGFGKRLAIVNVDVQKETCCSVRKVLQRYYKSITQVLEKYYKALQQYYRVPAECYRIPLGAMQEK